jgi:hypothetical protein
MRTLLAALAATTMLAAPAIAADEGPSFEKGPVWDFTQIQTKDGHFDEYMKWVSTDWKAQEEALKKAGVIVDYKVFLVTDPRDNEPDIVLAVESKNMAGFDRSAADEYAMQAKIAGSLAKANQDQAARGSIRTIRGDVLMREVTLK